MLDENDVFQEVSCGYREGVDLLVRATGRRQHPRMIEAYIVFLLLLVTTSR